MITQNDIDSVKALPPRKSILNLSADEIKTVEHWKERYSYILEEKSPFYRNLYGDKREIDDTEVSILFIRNRDKSFREIKKDIKNKIIFRGDAINSDIGMPITISRRGLEDTCVYARLYHDSFTFAMLYDIEKLINNSVLLDTVTSEKNNDNKAFNSVFMHKLYCLCNYKNIPYLAKLTIEEFAVINKGTNVRLYNVQGIKIKPSRQLSFTQNGLAISSLNGNKISIAQLFELVKTFDKNFYTNSPDFHPKFFPHNIEGEKDMPEIDTKSLYEEIQKLKNIVESQAKELQQYRQETVELKEDTLESKSILQDTQNMLKVYGAFLAANNEAQSFEKTMHLTEQAAIQLTGCDKVQFVAVDNGKMYCSDGEHKEYISGNAEKVNEIMSSTKPVAIGSSVFVPIEGESGNIGVMKLENKNGIDNIDLSLFEKGSVFMESIKLAVIKEEKHQTAITDNLTQLKNRDGLDEYLQGTLARNVNDNKEVCILMCDIDHFKNFNDTYGHDVGDLVLKKVAEIIKDNMRRGDDCAFRYGGEEMVCIINAPREEAVNISERLREEIRNTQITIPSGEQISVTISMGLHQMETELYLNSENVKSEFEKEYKIADNNVYAAKENGRDQLVCKEIGYNADIEIEVNDISKPAQEDRYSYYNNSAYEGIDNKEYINTDSKTAVSISKQAQAEGILHSVRYDKQEHKATLTFDGVKDKSFIDKVKAMIGENEQTRTSDKTPVTEEKQQESSNPDRYSTYNAKAYHNIDNKEYINTDSKTAVSISKQAQAEGILHSVRYDKQEHKATLTFDGVKNKPFVERLKKDLSPSQSKRVDKTNASIRSGISKTREIMQKQRNEERNNKGGDER